MASEESKPGDVARRLLRATDRAALATRLAKRDDPAMEAWPYASLVLLACDHDAAPLLLMSDLSEHAKNIAADPRLSLLIDGTAGRVDPLTGPRVSLLGAAEKTDDARLKARFIARHPSSSVYADFADFHLYRVGVARAHFVAGFGRIHWIESAEVGFNATASAGLADAEEALLAELNGRAGLADQLARRGQARNASGWRITGVDPEGIDLRREGSVARAEFAAPVVDASGIESAVAALLAQPGSRQKK